MPSIRTLIAVTLLLAAAACTASRRDPARAEAAPAQATAEPEQRTLAELEALYRARADSARLRYTPADVHFMTGMIAHHAQALVMAGLARTHGAGPAVTVLTGRIISAQQDEIALMQHWLRERGLPVPEPEIRGATLVVHGAGPHVHHMPGMLTEAQLQELDRARGLDFDRLLLVRMIEHHRGAVTMVRELFASPGAARDPVLARLASEIQADQTAEIARMLRLLAELSADDASRA